MKRASLLVLSLMGLMAGSGCIVSRAEYDKLYSSWESCDKERLEMRNTQAATDAKLKAVEDERNRVIIDRDLANANADKWRKAYEELASKPGEAPIVNITGPLPEAVDKALRELIKTYPGLEYDAARGAVRFSSDLLFDPGIFTLKGDVGKQLADFSRIINMPEAGKFDVLVVGHTDGMPISKPETRAKTPTNWHLSVYRAVEVVLALQGDKVDPKRLGAMGFGSERPRPGTTNGTKGTKENRRVEVFLVPREKLAATGMAPFCIPGEDIAAAFAK